MSQSMEPELYEKEKSILTEEMRTLSFVDDESESLADTIQTEQLLKKKASEKLISMDRREILKTPIKIDKLKLSKSFSI